MELNDSQRQAVNHTNGPLLVVAGAGTGKTRVIVERIARLIESGIDKRNILALTFTEKAAQEMLDRTAGLLEQSYGVELNIYTFNGFGQEILRESAVEIGLSSHMRLIGDTGKVVLLREHLDALGLDYFSPVSAPDRQLAEIANYFSALKQQLVKPKHYQAYAEALSADDEEQALEKQRQGELASAYASYIEITRSRNIIDYDDQLYLLVELLESRPNILSKLQQRFQYVLVDEFQDTNPMQSRLLDLLARKHNNIMVVGDDDQSIYGWRGATLANILEFKSRYSDTKDISLTTNYRSTQEILNSAYHMIQNNNPDRLEVINQLDKKLVAHRGNGKPPIVTAFSRLDAELEWVAQDIRSRLKKGIDPGSIAVLARRNDGVRRMHQVLDASGVEHTVAGMNDDIYRQPIVSTIIEALKTVVDPRDNQALYHTLGGSLFTFDPQSLSDVASVSRRTHVALESAVESLRTEESRRALEIIHAWRSTAHEVTVGTLAYKILDETGLKEKLFVDAQKSEESARIVQILGQWFNTLRDFESVADVASTLNYIQNLDALKAEGETISDDTNEILTTQPIVMSVHKAKGLEWDLVYIIDCTENTFPLRRFGSSLTVPTKLSLLSSADNHYNEERRLMYVAVTRARNQLTLTYSHSHNGITRRKPSRFLEEMFGELSDATHDQATTQMSLELFAQHGTAAIPATIPSSMLSGKNLVLSASQMNDYLRCPLDFRYRHIFHVPPAPDASRAIGTLFHSLLQRMNEAKMGTASFPERTAVLDELEKSWPREGFSSSKQRTRALNTARTSLISLYVRMRDDQSVPVAVEAPFRVHVPDSRLVLTGRIDAVISQSSGIEIRDYKTSTGTVTADKAKKSAQSSKQLEMYALAWRLQHGEMPHFVSLDFVMTGQLGVVKKQAKTINNLEKKLAKAADAILSGTFEPGRDHRFCRHPIELNI